MQQGSSVCATCCERVNTSLCSKFHPSIYTIKHIYSHNTAHDTIVVVLALLLCTPFECSAVQPRRNYKKCANFCSSSEPLVEEVRSEIVRVSVLQSRKVCVLREVLHTGENKWLGVMTARVIQGIHLYPQRTDNNMLYCLKSRTHFT